MNKNGFTLVELLAVIALIAILSGLAVTNVISSINNSKKNAFLMDAKRMVSKAEYLISMKKNDRQQASSSGKIYIFADLNEKDEFQKDADDGNFDSNSFVKVTKSGTSFNYCVCVIGSKRKITNGTNCNSTSGAGCVSSASLTGIDIVKDK